MALNKVKYEDNGRVKIKITAPKHRTLGKVDGKVKCVGKEIADILIKRKLAEKAK